MLKLLAALAENPWANLFAGLVLLATGLTEVVTRVEEAAIGAHHGVALYGLFQSLKSIPEILHGAEHVTRSRS